MLLDLCWALLFPCLVCFAYSCALLNNLVRVNVTTAISESRIVSILSKLPTNIPTNNVSMPLHSQTSIGKPHGKNLDQGSMHVQTDNLKYHEREGLSENEGDLTPISLNIHPPPTNKPKLPENLLPLPLRNPALVHYSLRSVSDLAETVQG